MSNVQELLAKRAELDRQIENAVKAEKSSAISEVKRLIAEFALTASDCGFSGRGTAKSAAKGRTVAPKYRAASGETWTGRGKPPRWITEYEKSGKSRTDLLI